MQQIELFVLFTGKFESIGLDYMVTGSVASMVYGEPRLTHDIDLVVRLPASKIKPVCDAFPLSDFYCPPEDILAVEARRKRRGHFNLIHHDTAYKADVYLCGDDPFHAWAMERRKRIELDDNAGLWLAPPEYVIVRKLDFFREGGSEKHLSDVRSMLAVSGDTVDRRAMEEWIDKLDLRRISSGVL